MPWDESLPPSLLLANVISAASIIVSVFVQQNIRTYDKTVNLYLPAYTEGDEKDAPLACSSDELTI